MSRGILALILILASITVLVAAAVTTYLVIASQRTPQIAVSAFLDGLIDGDATAAAALMTDVPTGNPAMLNPEAYAAATDRISGFTVLDATTDDDGDDAVATVEIEQGAESYEQKITLSLVRRDLGLFDVWRVDGSNLATVYVSYARPEGMDLTVNGSDFGVLVGSYEYNARALPGTWEFAPTNDTDFYTAEPVTVITRFADAKATAALPVVLTEAGVTAATAAVNAQLDGCTAQSSMNPGPACGFGLTDDGTYANAVYSNIVWSIAARPTFTFGDWRTEFGWALVPGTGGHLTATADFDSDEAYGTAEGSVTDFIQRGSISGIDESGVATFVSDYE